MTGDGAKIRIPRAASLVLRGHVERHLAAHGCTGQTLDDSGLDDRNLAEFLCAALRHACERRPWIGRGGVVVDALEDFTPAEVWAVAGALSEDDGGLTPDTCIAALASVLRIEVVDMPAGTREAGPRVYSYYPYGWPAALADRSALDHVQGVVTEAGWIDDRERRDRVFRKMDSYYYDDLSFVEIRGEVAVRLAAALWAGPERRGAGARYTEQGRAFVGLLGEGTRCFANRDFDEDALVDPFVRGETVGWSPDNVCSGGTILILLVTDGTLVASLHALWDTWSE